MNEIVCKLGNFLKLPYEKQLEFIQFHEELKHEFKVSCEENKFLKEKLSEAKEVSQ